MDTIYALASAPGRAGVAVIRVSGPQSDAAVRALAGDVPPPRRASLRSLRDSGGAVLDEALVITFAAGASFTGESAAEFQIHGSPAVVTAILRCLAAQPGLRSAEPGEFTRRAMESGRLDLTEVEGLSDLLAAETEAQRRQAQRVFSGALAARTESWRAALVRAMALIEVTVDFADEEVPEDVGPEVTALLAKVTAEMRREIDGVAMAERVRDGFEVAILGRPNAGKSTLLNALAGREAALTSEFAGTTRDVIEVRMDLNGLPVTFLDTAGLRETTDHVEQLGVTRARERAAAADLRVMLTDGPVPTEIALQPDDIVVPGKADLTGQGVSGLTGFGVPQLLERIASCLSARASTAGVAVHDRHRRALAEAVEALESAQDRIQGAATELVAEDVRRAVAALDLLVGRVDPDDVLGEIFRNFCLGK